MKAMSLKWRLSLLIGSVVAIVAASIPTILYFEMRESLFHQADQVLLTVATGITAVLDEDDDVPSQIADIKLLAGSAKRQRASLFYVWPDKSKNVFYPTDTRQDAAFWKDVFAKQKPPQTREFFDAGSHDKEYRCLWLRAQTKKGPMNIVVAQSSHYAYVELENSLWLMVLAGAGSVVGSMILVYLLVFWGLRPLRGAADAVRGTTVSNVGDVDIPLGKVPAEVRPFVKATSAMLGRVREAIRQQQQFVADASHELRTPLTVALSTLQAARMSDRDVATYKHALDETMQDLGHMEHLLNALLVLARMDETRGIEAAEEVQLEALLRGVSEQFASRIELAGGRLTLNLRPAVVWGNDDQLARLFGNLLDNAVKHGPAGGEVVVSVENDPPGSVSVCVCDAGGNIPPESLPRLFDRFYRQDPSRSSATGGAGLGLSIAREIALRHGGDITIHSKPGEGTRVCVRLPVVGGREVA